MTMNRKVPLFDRISWRDPVTGGPLEPLVTARTPAGVPISGALRRPGSNEAYPIVDSVARLTPELAWRHREWLEQLGLVAPEAHDERFQPEASVESFGFQWTWVGTMRTDADLRMRVAERFGLTPADFVNRLVLDAGAGAGDQSGYIVRNGGSVVSIDLSSAIDVVASKLRMQHGWAGVQGDITKLPFMDGQFDTVYCEGVLQHTRDSVMAVRELLRVVKEGGELLATHYTREEPRTWSHRRRRALTSWYYGFLRSRLSRMDRFKLLLTTGNLAALSYVPILGRALRASETALYYDLMPEFRTTWTNTFDFWGSHTFQRFITPDEFVAYFTTVPGLEIVYGKPGVVRSRKTGGDDVAVNERSGNE